MANEPVNNPPVPDNAGANQPQQPQAPAAGGKQYVDRSQLGVPSKAILIGIGVIILFAIWRPGIINELRDGAYARGLITLIVSLTAVGLAFLLVYQGILSDVKDEQFRRGREIFTGMMGVLGTIVGFYFGSADKVAPKPEIASVRVNKEKTELTTHVSGGAKPYNYVITYGASPIKGQSEDGWISWPIIAGVKTGKLDVTDSKDQKASLEFTIGDGQAATIGAPSSGATGTGGASGTAPAAKPTATPTPSPSG